MRSFLLLVLSLMTGGEASAQVEGCADGWVDFTCPYPKNKDGQYESLSVVNPTKKSLKITKKDEDEIRDRVHVARDTDNKKVRVIIKQLRQEDIDEWKCEFGSSTNQHKGLQELETDEDECQKPFHQAAYKTAKTTIACEYPENSYESNVKFFCKESGSICKDILATQSSPLKNRMFTLTESYRGFNVSISKVSSQHKGVYWCGVKSKDGSYQAGLRQIRLTVEDIQADFKRSPTVGHNLTYWCKYQEESHIFICKGEDPSICPPLLNNSEQTSNERFSMEEDKTKKNITITVRHVTMQDNGTYWCGARSTDNTRSNTFFHRLSLIVVPLSTTAVSTTQSTPAASGDGLGFIIALIICAVVLLLLFLLILILISKRFSHSRRTRNGAAAAPNIKEDYIYTEIQERVRNPDSGDAMKTIYATVDFPTNPSASLHYSVVNFRQSSDKAGGEAVILKPSSSACEYSSVKNSQSQADGAVNHPSTPSEDPLYSTVNKKQKQ